MAFDCCQNFDLAEYPENEEVDFVQNLLKPASDACPTGDQEIVGLIPTGSGNILSWIDHEIFFMVILFLPLFQERQLSIKIYLDIWNLVIWILNFLNVAQ